MRIAVIGAGVSGLACARGLVAGGMEVTVFERSGRVGGRASTFHLPWGSFDHGAQYFTARGRAFRQILKHWIDGGIAAAWEMGAPRVGDPLAPEETLYVGTPGMAAIGGALAAGLRLQLDCEIGQIHRSADGRWRLYRRDGRDLGSHDWVISSAPAPVTTELLQPIAPDLADEAGRCRYSACWAVLARCENWNARGPALMQPTGSPLSWVANDSIKPGRTSQPTWVLHASPEWSNAHLDATPDLACEELLDAWTRLGAPRVGISSAFLWRHALAETLLGQPFLLCPERRVGACGDWCIAPRLESAFDSGLALSRAIRRVRPAVDADEEVTA